MQVNQMGNKTNAKIIFPNTTLTTKIFLYLLSEYEVIHIHYKRYMRHKSFLKYSWPQLLTKRFVTF